MTVILSGILSAMAWGLAEAGTYRESPMLAMRVAAGELPPIGERLPRDPMVVHPYERIGAYGGQMRVVTGKVNALNETQFMLYTPLLRFASDGRTIVPNVARHWEASDDATSFTFYLREGMRWSDGVPVTSEDVRFAWEDVLLHKAITPVLPAMYRIGGEPMQLEIVDTHTFRMVFSQPFGTLPYFVTRTIGEASIIQPRHYLEKYHARYADEAALNEAASERGFAFWYERFADINHTRNAPTGKVPPDYPTLSPWQVAETPATGHAILRRNPFHWQVDSEGNQLPYIDEIHSEYVGNPEARNLKFASGQIDFGGSFARFDNSPLFLANRRRGGYRVFFWKENQGTRVAYYFNQTIEDREKRSLFQDRRFRIAMSHAVNRREINEVVYYGQCLPRQDTVNRVCTFFEPWFESAHAEYDPDRAERMLDEAGLRHDGISQWRKMPSGRTLTITLDAFPIEPYMKTAELIREYWQAVGVLLNLRIVQPGLAHVRVAGNKHDVAGYPNDCATDVMVFNEPLYGISYWAPLWYNWFQSPEDDRRGEEPPVQIKKLYAVWSRLRSASDAGQRLELGRELIRSQADNLWGIGTVGESLGPIIVSNRLHNVAEWMLDGAGKPMEGRRALWGWPWLATFLHHPEQWFIQE